MSSPSYVVIERVTRVAPFGIGLWDGVSGRLVSDGIRVRVFSLAGTRLVTPVPAIPNRLGVFVPHELTRQPSSPSDIFVVEVRDTLDRYTSFVMHVGEPNTKGFALPRCSERFEVASSPPTSPASETTFVPLFGTSARFLPGKATVRATLRDAVTGEPAEFAVLEVHHSGQLLGRGIADHRGEAMVQFAYPESTGTAVWSPPHAAPPPQRLVDQVWRLDIAIRFRRGLQRFETDRTRVPDPARRRLADLCDILEQPLVSIVPSSPPVASEPPDLRFGEALVLGRVRDREPGADARAELLIAPV